MDLTNTKKALTLMNVSYKTIYDIYYFQNKKKNDTCILYIHPRVKNRMDICSLHIICL